jgi:hypothetical protein
MEELDLKNTIVTLFTENVQVLKMGDGFLIHLPFTDNDGESIEVYLENNNTKVTVNDLGHVAGLLFQLGQHNQDTTGHLLTKSITEAYDIVMDYDRGVLYKSVSIKEISKILDFFQALIAIKTTLPELKYRKQVRKTGKRLVSLMGREIKQLKLPLYVQRQTEVEGKNETWTVDFKYSAKRNGHSADVIIVTADFKWGEPREKAAHALTLAVDVLDFDRKRDLRIVYDVGTNRNGKNAQRAARLLENHQNEIGYKVFNYGDRENKSVLMSQINQELSPYLFKQKS